MSASRLELRGFVICVSAVAVGSIYVLIALLPADAFHAVGIYYYPDAYWTLAIPSFLAVSIVAYTFSMVFLSYYRYSAPLSSFNTVSDRYARPEVLPSLADEAATGRVPDAFDIPLTTVNKLLFYSSWPGEAQSPPQPSALLSASQPPRSPLFATASPTRPESRRFPSVSATFS
eukprot:TRINITY_DN45457_c0_g1_i1.p1 TRINITY_DN45457_c0_g1~~TRINITY_DN45457_c0_g1_i1.p1  ORF type:complete len:174 (-),score=5.27 TRINITY_DN45457_c0_g1_i1:602-1123(-)